MVALDSLHDDFETTTTSMLERGDKTIEEIQQILASAEAKFLSKRATGVTADLAMMSKGKGNSKRKATSDNRCYNCHKFGHLGEIAGVLTPTNDPPPSIRNESPTNLQVGPIHETERTLPPPQTRTPTRNHFDLAWQTW